MKQDTKEQEPTVVATFVLVGPDKLEGHLPEYEAHMRVSNTDFTDETVHAEGMRFSGCTFVRCTICVDSSTLFLGAYIYCCNFIFASEVVIPILFQSFIHVRAPISKEPIEFRLIGRSYIDKEMPQSEYKELVRARRAAA